MYLSLCKIYNSIEFKELNSDFASKQNINYLLKLAKHTFASNSSDILFVP